MDTTDLSDRIAAIEDDIETQADIVARSRRLVLLSRVAGFGGGAWLLAILFGLAPWDAAGLVFAIAMMVGSMVAAGSSLGTIREAEQRLETLDRLRETLIDAVSPMEIADEPSNVIPLRLRAAPER